MVPRWLYLAALRLLKLFQINGSPISGKQVREVLDGRAHFYGIYETKDDKLLSVAAVEADFYRNLLTGLGFAAEEIPQFGPDTSEYRAKLRSKFKEKTRDEWCHIFKDLDACVAPVLTLEEAVVCGHHVKRGAFRFNEELNIHYPVQLLTRLLLLIHSPRINYSKASL